jgi:hypothetical protein
MIHLFQFLSRALVVRAFVSVSFMLGSLLDAEVGKTCITRARTFIKMS